MVELEADALWKSAGLLSIYLRTKEANYNFHFFPLPKYWLFGSNPYWKNQRVLDFGCGPLFRFVCIQSLEP